MNEPFKVWSEDYDRIMREERPEECTRRRMKPNISDCQCDWCKRLDDLLSRIPPRTDIKYV